MDQDTRSLLSLPRLPARLTAEQSAALLGFTPEGIGMLVAARLLKPLGKERRGVPIILASEEVLRLGADRQWLSRATDIVRDVTREKNEARRRRGSGSGGDEGNAQP